MTFRFVPLLVALAINLLLGTYILVTRRAGVWARVFVALCFAASLWCGAGVVYFLSGGKEIWLRPSLLGALLIPAIYHYYLARAYQVRVSLGRLPVLAAIVLVVFALAVFPWPSLGLPEQTSHLIHMAAIGIYLGGFYLSFLLGLRAAIRSADSESIQQQLRFELWATILPFVFILLQTLLYTFLYSFWPKLPTPNLSLALVLGAELVLYSFLSSRRVIADELVTEGMAYLVYLVLISGVVSLCLFLLDRIPGIDFTPAQFLLVLVLTALSALLVAAARDKIRLWVEQALFPEKYEYRQMIERYESELEKMQQRLKEAERLAVLGEVAASIAHEIRNPLGPIKGYAQMFLQADEHDLPKPELVRKGLTIIAEEVKKIDERVERLLALGRPATSARSAIALRQLVEQTAALFRFHPIFSPALEIKLALDDGLELIGDRGMLESAVYNLLLNAAQACEGRGAIAVRCSRKEAKGANWIVLEVSDDGPGIGPETQARLFEPFFSQRRGGVGLGLCIVKRAVDEHRGWIEVKSQPGQGAKFCLFFPDQSQR